MDNGAGRYILGGNPRSGAWSPLTTRGFAVRRQSTGRQQANQAGSRGRDQCSNDQKDRALFESADEQQLACAASPSTFLSSCIAAECQSVLFRTSVTTLF